MQGMKHNPSLSSQLLTPLLDQPGICHSQQFLVLQDSEKREKGIIYLLNNILSLSKSFLLSL